MRSSCYQAPPSEKKALYFIRSLSSPFLKNTGGSRMMRSNPARKRVEGGFFELGLTVKAKELIRLQTRARSPRCWDGAPSLFYFRAGCQKQRSLAAKSWSPNGAAFLGSRTLSFRGIVHSLFLVLSRAERVLVCRWPAGDR
jgi:hypothetical protein